MTERASRRHELNREAATPEALERILRNLPPGMVPDAWDVRLRARKVDIASREDLDTQALRHGLVPYATLHFRFDRGLFVVDLDGPLEYPRPAEVRNYGEANRARNWSHQVGYALARGFRFAATHYECEGGYDAFLAELDELLIADYVEVMRLRIVHEEVGIEIFGRAPMILQRGWELEHYDPGQVHISWQGELSADAQLDLQHLLES